MAPTRGKRNQQLRDSLKEEDILQAIVIADSFNSCFDPITYNKPTVLLPLVNVPLLDYTLQFLSAAGVQEITVFCCNHADQIRKHLEKSRWLDVSSPCSVSVIVSDCLSVGDALREVDSKAMIRTDFILVFGDTVANLRLKEIMEKHRKKKETDKSSVLTMIYKNAAPKHHARVGDDDTLLVIDSTTQRILDYRRTSSVKDFAIPVETLTDHKSVRVQYNLLDTHVCVCSPLVPQLFTDNFDYSTMDDLVRGLLNNEEILGNTIHVETVSEEYACRVSNLGMYDAVSRDVMNRWTYPYVPELMTASASSEESMSCGRHSVYTSQSVTLARGCVLERSVVIGPGTSVGTNSSISSTVIGRNCHIGENVTIRASYIWDDVVIGDNCSLDTCIVCDGGVIREGVTASGGCVLSWNVDVGPSVTLPPHTLLMSEPRVEVNEFGDEPSRQDDSSQVASSQYGNRAFVYCVPCESDVDDEADVVRDTWGVTAISEDDESDASSVTSGDSDEMARAACTALYDDAKVFYSEMLDTLRRAKEENIGADNQVLEINSLKHAYNITIKDVNMMVIQALVEMPFIDQPDLEPAQYHLTVKKCFKTYLGLIQNYIKNHDSQLHCLQALEESSLQKAAVASALVKVIHFLYEADVIQEQVIVSWYEGVVENEERQERLDVRKPRGSKTPRYSRKRDVCTFPIANALGVYTRVYQESVPQY